MYFQMLCYLYDMPTVIIETLDAEINLKWVKCYLHITK